MIALCAHPSVEFPTLHLEISSTKTHPPFEPMSQQNSIRMGIFPTLLKKKTHRGGTATSIGRRDNLILGIKRRKITGQKTIRRIIGGRRVEIKRKQKREGMKLNKKTKTNGDMQQFQCFQTLNGQFFQMMGSDTRIDGSFCGCC